MALKIEFKSRRTKSYELQVCQILRDLENSNISLISFPDTFKGHIEKIPRASVAMAWMFYRATVSDDFKKAEVWHLNVHGEPDRLLAIVTDDGKEFNPFNF